MFNVNNLKLWLEELSVNELHVLINGARTQITDRQRIKITQNAVDLEWEILNLLDKVGNGYISRDYYAGERYYSMINGVKNLRINKPEEEKEYAEIIVKILSPRGKLLPKEIVVRGIRYKVVFIKSKNYDPTVDY